MKTQKDCKDATAELGTLLNACEIAKKLFVKKDSYKQ
jgi:hypothetical protein